MGKIKLMRALGRYIIEPITFSKYTKSIGEGAKKLGGKAPIFFNTSSQVKIDHSVKNAITQLKNTPFSDLQKAAASLRDGKDVFVSSKPLDILPAIPNFSKYKSSLIRKLKAKGLDEKLLTSVAEAKDEQALKSVLRGEFKSYVNIAGDLIDDKLLKFKDAERLGRINFRVEQYARNFMRKSDKKIVDLCRMISQKDVNPEVLAIKDKLKKVYGLKEVRLDNNPEFAKNCLEAMELLRKNGIKPPDSIIGTALFNYGGISTRVGKDVCIIVDPFCKTLNHASTKSPLHSIVHESVHCVQPDLLAFNLKKIPKKYHNTMSNLSPYAAGNKAHEVHSELQTKKILEQLTAEEEELFTFLGGMFK